MDDKTCTKCQETKPLSDFGKSSRAKDGLQWRCKDCLKEVSRQWRAENTEKVREYARQATKRWYAEHPGATYERVQRWRAENPERYRDNNIRNNGERRVRNAGGVVQKGIDATTLLERQGGMCYLCLTPIDTALRHPDPASLSVDHLVPISKGGDHTLHNGLATHLGCNLAKRAKPLHTLSLPLLAPVEEVAA